MDSSLDLALWKFSHFIPGRSASLWKKGDDSSESASQPTHYSVSYVGLTQEGKSLFKKRTFMYLQGFWYNEKFKSIELYW